MSNRKNNRLIMGTAIGLATIAVAIDHTRHKLPEPVDNVSTEYYDSASSPCSMESPCAMDSPCSLESPCAMDSPCSLDTTSSPCSM